MYERLAFVVLCLQHLAHVSLSIFVLERPLYCVIVSSGVWEEYCREALGAWQVASFQRRGLCCLPCAVGM